MDQRSDIYSLGMVLFEFLTGEGPFTQKGSYSALPVLIELMAMERTRTVPSARQKRSDVPWSLESILRKCLLPDPAQRYQQASHLALDLRRFLEDQPLRFAPELSRVECVGKWFRRHPRLTSSVTVAVIAAVLLAGVAWSLAGIRRNLEATQGQLDSARDGERKRAFEEGTRRALCLVNTTADMQDHLRQGSKACRDALALYGVLGGEDWQQRPDWKRLDAEDRLRLGEDARELLLLLAWTEVRQAPGNAALDRRWRCWNGRRPSKTCRPRGRCGRTGPSTSTAAATAPRRGPRGSGRAASVPLASATATCWPPATRATAVMPRPSPSWTRR